MDDLLSEITDAGYLVHVRQEQEGDLRSCCVQATDPYTGMNWICHGPTAEAAGQVLAKRLGIIASDGEAGAWNPAAQRAVMLRWSLAMTGAIFVVDLLLPGINLGVLYLVPQTLAFRAGLRRGHMLALVLVMGVLIYLDALVGEQWRAGVHPEPAGLTNRAFAFAVLVFRALATPIRRDRRISRGQRRLLGAIALLLAGATFASDLATPEAVNLSIMYVAPLVILSLVLPPWRVWACVPFLVGSSLMGYLLSPNGGLNAAEGRLVATNRLITLALLPTVAFLWAHKREALSPRRRL